MAVILGFAFFQKQEGGTSEPKSSQPHSVSIAEIYYHYDTKIFKSPPFQGPQRTLRRSP